MSSDSVSVEDEDTTLGLDVRIDERTGDLNEETSTDDTASGYLVGRESNASPVLSIVMPTLNEEEGIGECLDQIESAVAELGLPAEILVSDSSRDGTPEIARDRGAIVVEPDQPGYGHAYRYAFERARGEYVAMGDADTTYNFEEIPRLLSHLEETGVDIVMGNRLEGEIKPDAMPPLHQYIGNPLLTKFLNFFYDTGVSDAHSGFRVFRRDILEGLHLESDGMEFASEMVIKAGANGLTISEVPITYHEREGEATLDSFRDGWRHVRFMLMNAPGYLFSVPAITFGLVGIAMLFLSILDGQLSGIFFGAHTAILGSLLTIVGFQVGSLAVFSAVTADSILTPNDAVIRWIRENVRLEHGVTAGFTLFSVGTIYLIAVAILWLTSGDAGTLMIVPNMFAFTAVILGIQAVFSSFFLSMIAADTGH